MQRIMGLSAFHEELVQFLEKNIAFPELTETYQSLLGSETAFLEQSLLKAFAPYGMRIYRGLPRFYRREKGSESVLKKDFSDLPALKKLAAEQFVFPLYRGCPLPLSQKVTVFTWVIGDGLGDFVAASETIEILQARFPVFEFSWIILLPKAYSSFQVAKEYPTH